MQNDQSNGDLPLEPAGTQPGAATPAPEDAVEGTRERIRRLPPEVGAVLVTVGVAGVILPGPIGAPLLLAGGLVLMPAVFEKFERWVGKRYPRMHGEGMKYVDRFIDDFERRYPPDKDAK
jgi:hypothetical protein